MPERRARRAVALLLAPLVLAGCVQTTTDPVQVTTGGASASVPGPTSVAPSATASPSRTSSTTRPPTTLPPASGSAAALLTTLPVKGRAPRTGYDRDEFGPSWTDDTDAQFGHNGCDTRNDVLRRDLTDETFRPGTRDCVVLTGLLRDPYTGRVIDFVRGQRTSIEVQIDHVVALGDAWQKGAQQLDEQQRTTFANDPLNLLAVDGPTNASKGDGDAATWLPPARSFRCAYVARQVAVKARYRLWVTVAERDAIARILRACPGQSAPVR
ncbi:HNH endonuclease family protein [Jatrophihabitans fulvus]